ncbi:GH32 C-terminal domain-containing protein [Clostridium beijerinckii]|jgi:Beta-fructosidases (levanase/invertase)|uniref:GH32 C-terminal domain-containing protein n=2 Tax=Clostridium beijerinckii TaxID=1520 RepID=A0AAE2RPP8_CLOBE|nr:GH32 C-terminal domain-containing protein [Clostridium beijerinckii]ABR35984.1 Glycosyl hydrolase family 32, N terminal domain protein [Clostridium beijerinckii NCIMB 8052]AIU03466.1 glycosyl hydrolase family 32 protein [Clostridium beijerinckii ATCC 35702]MBF7809375.1 GH32 C-terminal domain-containing protein [Clostridium beijerinckii]NRT22970.1 fructan beta-fructosidase [Clostridium beijerinckii]NRT69870.1 fructan beta-fructosidase [Clostridium beijerinckii]
MKKLKLKLIAITVATMTTATFTSVSASAAWIQNEGNWNYLSDSGEMKTGWVNDNGAWYYLDNSGTMKTGWVNDSSTWYYMQPSGEMKTGWVNDNGAWYYLDNSGTMKTGWINDSGTWYYMQPSGAMKTGWISDNGTWYFADTSGTMQTGVVKIDGKTYYLDETTGAMRVGDITINGTTHTFAQSGEAIRSDLVPTKTFNSNGVKVVETSTQGSSDKTSDNNKSNTTTSEQSNSTSTTSSGKSHHSSGSSSTKVNKEALINAITIAKTKYEAAVEGTDAGQYSVGSKAIFKAAIDAAQAVSDNTGSTQKDIDSAVTALASATTIFNDSLNKDVDSSTSTNYLEDYRDQYHFSVAKAWGNDPNGMVYYNGEWHLFYQYYPDDEVWGPMHWGQAVSKDLIHWKELGVALEPGDDKVMGEGSRYIFSGSAVVDENDSTGFFDGGSGLVAIYTQHIEGNKLTDEECDYLGVAHGTVSNTEEQSIAYSKDNGRTWTKYNGGEPVLKITDDPLKRPAEFRDPKVFYNEEAGKWFMVVAGGPLRFFSSDNLIDWKPEAMQPEITTECPDFFKMKVEGTDQEKWVLNQAGRYYRIGDFKQVGGKWTFVPETGAIQMNFSKDSYAAQTYYGTGENGTPDGRRIMINWMNNWDYCNQVKKITGTFNGSYTLQNELKLVQTDDGIRLIQEPIEEYKSLRQTPTTYDGVISSNTADNAAININNLSGSQYEIVAEFEPDATTTECGFKLRVGKDVNQETIVKYDVETGEVVIDRSKSGKTPVSGSAFANSYSSEVNKTADGKIQLHIFVDAASVEVYGNDGEVAGTAQIFPDRNSTGIEVYSVGGNTKANITYYPLKGIWNNENASALSLSESALNKEVGDEFTIYTSVLPSTLTQGVTWNISNHSIVTILSQDDKKTTFRVLGEGNTNLIATSKDGKLQKTTTLSVVNRSLPSTFSGLSNVEASGSDWYKDGDAYVANGSGDGFAMLDEKNYDSTATYTFETDVEIAKGTAGLVLGSAVKNSPSEGSVVANLTREGAWRLFKFPGGANLPDNEHGSGNITPDVNGKYHMKAVLKGNHIQYYINDKLMDEVDYNFSAPGNFGFNIYNGNVKFTNAKLTVAGSDTSSLGIVKTNYEQNMGDEFTVYANQDVKYKIGNQDVVQIINGTDSKKITFKVVGAGETTLTVTPVSGSASPVIINVSGYDINPDATPGLITGLKNFTTSGAGKWYVKTATNTGDTSYAVKSTGDTFAMSSTKVSATNDANYNLETEATVLNPDDNCAPSLVLFSKSKDNPKDGSLVFNVQTNNGHWKVFEFGGSLIGEGNITPTEDGKYDLKVDVVGQTVKYFINGQELLSTSDFTQRSGYVGLMSWNANTEFRNTVFKSVDTVIGSDIAVATGAAVATPVSTISDTIGNDIRVTTGAAITVATPVTGETPVSTIDDTDQYTATIEWNENPAIFEANKVYTATITIKPKEGYTIIGVPKDYFKVDGAIATNDADSGVIKAVFPETN